MCSGGAERSSRSPLAVRRPIWRPPYHGGSADLAGMADNDPQTVARSNRSGGGVARHSGEVATPWLAGAVSLWTRYRPGAGCPPAGVQVPAMRLSAGDAITAAADATWAASTALMRRRGKQGAISGSGGRRAQLRPWLPAREREERAPLARASDRQRPIVTATSSACVPMYWHDCNRAAGPARLRRLSPSGGRFVVCPPGLFGRGVRV